jgi:uncharacterized RDD family membrane protein YckC
MAATADVAATPKSSSETVNEAAFSYERLKAPFFLRCGALIIDYILVVATPIIWLLATKFLGEGHADTTMNNRGWVIAAIVAVANTIILPTVGGKSVGKMLTGLTIVKTDGSRSGVWRTLLRNTIGYLLTLVTLGLGFLISAVNSSGRSLHDFVAGTIVVAGKKTLM